MDLLGFRRSLETPEARRGFVLLMIMSAAFGMALSVQDNVVSNYFGDVLGLEGPQFGYITAIREVPGFLLIFLTALFYKMSIPRLTAMMLLLLAGGMMLFTFSSSFWTVAPWVVITSMGYHTVLQTQYALGLSLTTEQRAGAVLGRLTAVHNGGALVAMGVVFLIFTVAPDAFRPTFVLAGLMALIAAAAVFRFPNLHDGVQEEVVAERPKLVIRKPYRYYYYLHLLDGARMQIFFSFGLYVLVVIYGMSVREISLLLVATKLLAMVTGPWIGNMIDRHGEKPLLGALNFIYIAALAGYALIDNVYVASFIFLVYSVIFPLSSVGSATYLRKVAVRDEIAPSLAMGVTLSHAAAIVVPVTTGYILNYVGYQVPFLIACVIASFTILVTRRLDPASQRSPARIEEDRRISERLAPASGVADGD
ncbi:MAG TPA: MFS transporter [Thermomicrobiales bacterium]|nr:MFS transporter [Thermomicrobiales bacterium]